MINTQFFEHHCGFLWIFGKFITVCSIRVQGAKRSIMGAIFTGASGLCEANPTGRKAVPDSLFRTAFIHPARGNYPPRAGRTIPGTRPGDAGDSQPGHLHGTVKPAKTDKLRRGWTRSPGKSSGKSTITVGDVSEVGGTVPATFRPPFPDRYL